MASRLRIESHSATPSPTLILDTPADFQLIVFPLGISVLPRRPRGCRPISDAHGANTSNKHLTIGSVAVTDEITGSMVPSAGLDQLLGDPFRGWMRGGPQPQKPAPVMPQDEQTDDICSRYRVSDNGAELTGMAILRWSQETQVEWYYIAPGKPQQNASIERYTRGSAPRPVASPSHQGSNDERILLIGG